MLPLEIATKTIVNEVAVLVCLWLGAPIKRNTGRHHTLGPQAPHRTMVQSDSFHSPPRQGFDTIEFL